MVATIPAPISTVMFTGDMMGILWWAVVLALDIIIYYPFFKTFEKVTMAEEEMKLLKKEERKEVKNTETKAIA